MRKVLAAQKEKTTKEEKSKARGERKRESNVREKRDYKKLVANSVVVGRGTFDIHLRSPAHGAALRRSSWMWSLVQG